MHPALPLHRHQSSLSLEGIIDFSAQPPLTPAQRLSAGRRFNQLVNHFDVPDGSSYKGYDRVKLVRLTHDYARSEESKGNFLRAFFELAELPIDGDEDGDEDEDEDDLALDDADQQARLRDSLFNFAEYLFHNFFLPLKVSTKTPQPSPASHSAIQRAQGEGYSFSGTLERVSVLRGACLLRDRYRCVISRKFDQNEALKRSRHGDEARDEDGVPLPGQSFDALKVVHILPRSLTQVNADKQLDPSKEAALAILNIFDSGAAFLVEGTDIDQPRNAMTLAPCLHKLFSDFRIFFEPLDQQPHTYRIDTFVDHWLLENLLPVSRTLYLTDLETIDPPSARLLAISTMLSLISFTSLGQGTTSIANSRIWRKMAFGKMAQLT